MLKNLILHTHPLATGMKLFSIITAALLFSSSAVYSDEPFVHLSGRAIDPARESLSFGSTQKWKRKHLIRVAKPPKYLPDNWLSRVGAALPPKNSSVRTRAELDYLIQLQQKRTPEDIIRIEKAIPIGGHSWGGLTYRQIVDPATRPGTAALAKAANDDILIVIMASKLHFNRVRPSFLDARIKPAIPIPAHPAYPSGHSTQTHMWAYLLCELTDERRHKAILADAELIAQDRELAGVHYPSDSAAGQRIARRVVDLWMENPGFRRLLDAAKAEWVVRR